MSYLAPDNRLSPPGDAWPGGGAEARLGDVNLVVGIGRRRTAVLAEVYGRHGGPLFDVASRVCGPVLAEEVVRTVLMDLWRDPGRFDPDRSSLRGFLLQQAHATAVEAVRAGHGAAGGGSMPADVGRARGSWALDRVALAGRSGVHAWSLLSALPDDQRDTVALAYSCGYSSRDLGALLDEPEATVWTRIRTALTGLGDRTGRTAPSR